ncbi:MAG: Rpn family recombination-promoting nuclease/putative transposase [Desulfocapsa sp.]|nr:Rpn family recombination-promoting nuclease/putative transposase [Desulfocapsa sp.]
MERKLISFDWAIKRLLRSKANFGILEGFLSELVFTDITILELLESETNKEDEKNRYNRVDIKVKDSNNQIILIEVQYSRELDFLFRILFETSKSLTEHLKEGTPYSDVVKVISVNILFFDFCHGDDYIYHGTTTFIGLHNKSVLELTDAQQQLFNKEKIANIYPEYYLINVKNFDDIAKDSLDEWVYFLKNEEIKSDFKAKGLQEAKEKLDVMKMNPADKYAYEQHKKELHRRASMYESTYVIGKLEGKDEGIEEGIEIGIKQGIEKGENKNNRNIAGIMKKRGYSLEEIANITGLTVEEIKQSTR